LPQASASGAASLGIPLIELDVAATKGVINRLYTRGFLEFRQDPDDCRCRVVTLTKSGRRITEAAVESAVQIAKETLSPEHSRRGRNHEL
jgi:MarR family transcriptional regulator, lower aerobic nicotinate degradation pathway regulator